MKKVLLLICISISLFGCAKSGVSTTKTDNPSVSLDLICTTPEGAKVYRFYDCNHFVYVTVLPGSTQYNTGGDDNQRIQNSTN